MKIKIEDIVKYYKKEKVSRLKYYNALSKKEIKESKKTIEPFYEKMKTGLFVMEGKNIIAHNMLINLFMFSLKVPNLTTIGSVLIENSVNINLSHLLKDKDFEIGFKKMLIVFNRMFFKKYGSQAEDLLHTPEKLNDLLEIFNCDLDSFIISYVLEYFMINGSPTDKSMRSLVSFFFKSLKVKFLIDGLTTEQEKWLEEIQAGIGLIKTKIENEAVNNSGYQPTGKVNVVNYLSHQIRTKYITNKLGKHFDHKSPCEHTRRGHYRILRNGKRKWFPQTTVNLGVA